MSIVLFLLASLTLAFPAAAAQSAPVNLQFALNWKAEPEFGGFYAAKLAGHFEKRGLNVDITEGGAGTPVVQMVANSKVPFGIAAADEVVIAQARGADVVALFAVYQTNPQGIMVHPERGFKSIADVFNSPGTLAIQNGSPHTLFLQAKFAKAKVKLVPYAGGIATFLTDPNYSQQCFVTSEPLLAKKKSVPANSFLIADEGFKPYGTVVDRASPVRREKSEANPRFYRRGSGRLARISARAAKLPMRLMVKLNPAIDSRYHEGSRRSAKAVYHRSQCTGPGPGQNDTRSLDDTGKSALRDQIDQDQADGGKTVSEFLIRRIKQFR